MHTHTTQNAQRDENWGKSFKALSLNFWFAAAPPIVTSSFTHQTLISRNFLLPTIWLFGEIIWIWIRRIFKKCRPFGVEL